jgi:PilZ domain
MSPRANMTNGMKITDRILSLVQNLSEGKKKLLLDLLVEWQQTENRSDSRISCFFPVNYTTPKRAYNDFIQDLSKGGLFIETRESLQVDDPVALTFSNPKSNTHFKMRGKIVRVEPNGVAIQFDTKLTDYQEDAIKHSLNLKRPDRSR